MIQRNVGNSTSKIVVDKKVEEFFISLFFTWCNTIDLNFFLFQRIITQESCMREFYHLDKYFLKNLCKYG